MKIKKYEYYKRTYCTSGCIISKFNDSFSPQSKSIVKSPNRINEAYAVQSTVYRGITQFDVITELITDYL